MKLDTKTWIIVGEVILFAGIALGVWYYRSLDSFALERDAQGQLRDGEKFLYGPASSETLAAGADLAQAHCGGCHLLPAPERLPAAGWRPVLENMGVRLGLAHRLEYLNDKQRGLIEGLKSTDQYPAAAALTPEEFQILKKYYYANAAEIDAPAPADWPAAALFRAAEPLQLARTDLTLVKILPAGEILAGGMVHERPGDPDGFLARFDRDRKEISRRAFQAPPVSVVLADENSAGTKKQEGNTAPGLDGALLTTLGDPAGARRFPATVYRLGAQGQARSLTTRDFRLTRAEGFRPAADTEPYLLLSGFGFLRGGLILEGEGGAQKATELESGPGPIDTRVFDADGDGREDIVALTAQAREGLFLYHNLGRQTKGAGVGEATDTIRLADGRRLRRIVLNRRHPGFGSTGLDAGDFDGDGRADILAVNGDNADFPDAPVKLDHGLRFYKNESRPGAPAFREAFFFRMFGATRAISADFDGDGDLDVAAVALYAVHPRERFLFLENLGDFRFRPQALPVPGEPVCGVLDAGDLDGDGDPDLVLGALPFFSDPAGPGAAAKGEARPVLFVLTNLRR